MKTQTCQICKKEEAYKRVFSNIDDSFFLVCKEKKCIKQLHQMIKSPKDKTDFIREIQWDRNEHQGRSYQQIKSRYEMLDIMGYIIGMGIISMVLYFMMKNLI